MLDSQSHHRLLERGRQLVGVSGEEPTESLRSVLRRHDLGFYPVIALGLLAFVDCFMNLAAPRLRAAFIALLAMANTVIGGMVGTLLIAELDQRVGLTWALILLDVPFLIGLLILRQIRDHINTDLNRMVNSLTARSKSPPCG